MYAGKAIPGKYLLAFLLAAATIIVFVPHADGATSTSTGAPVPELDWQDCDGGFQCASAEVPLDYDRPHGRTIEVGLIRDPAESPGERIGSLSSIPVVREARA